MGGNRSTRRPLPPPPPRPNRGRASENSTYYIARKFKPPAETRTHTLAWVAGSCFASGRAYNYTTRGKLSRQTCSHNCICCHTEIEVADQTFYLAQSQYTDTWPISPRADPITANTWQGSHWTVSLEVTGMAQSGKKSQRLKSESNPGSAALEADALTTRLTRRCDAVCFVCWSLNVPSTCECISGTDLLRQFYVLPH